MLVQIDGTGGCYPRYTCMEMEKVATSVMRFRLGDRNRWPLPHHVSGTVVVLVTVSVLVLVLVLMLVYWC